MHPAIEGPLNVVGRTLLVLIFLMSGLGKITEFESTAGFMKSKGMPAPQVFLVGAIVFEIVGAASVITGFKARYGAFLLAVFLVPAAMIFHNFWAETDPMVQKNQMIHFMKNLAMFGGMLIVIARGAGPWSIDNVLARRTPPPPAAA